MNYSNLTIRKLVLLTFVFIASSIGCAKEDKGCMGVKPEDEAPQIEAFATANGISFTQLNGGIYYHIAEPGTGKSPNMKSSVTVKYTGKFLNGNTFEQNSYYTHLVSDVIEGWQLGLPLIKEGGKIALIIPSTYAYGCNGKDNVPANSVLYYDVTLLHVQ